MDRLSTDKLVIEVVISSCAITGIISTHCGFIKLGLMYLSLFFFT